MVTMIVSTIVAGLVGWWACKNYDTVTTAQAVYSELGDLLEAVAKAAEDGDLSTREARVIGKQGLDSWKAIQKVLSSKKG